MSRIYFHSPTDTAEVYGSERAAASILTENLFAASLYLSQFTKPDDKIFSLLHEKDRASIRNYSRPDEAFMSLCRFGECSFILPDGQTIPVWDVIFNTALVVGSDPIKLLTRLHAQCEIHTYVEGPNREWLADIVHEGLKIGIMRDDMGWQEVETLLRMRDDEPVVTSYSVCEPFPNLNISTFVADTDDESGEEASDQWYELPVADQWEMALEGLRQKAEWLEMRPDFWADYYFSNGYTGFDLTKIALAKI